MRRFDPRLTIAIAAALVLAVLPASAHANAQIAQSFRSTGSCLSGTYVVPHGVQQISVQAAGQYGQDGVGADTYGPDGLVDGHADGGRGGGASHVVTTLSVHEGETLYVGVANSNASVNALPGGVNGINGDNGLLGGEGGAASWISTVAPATSGGQCTIPSTSDWLVVAAGGGGGGGGASRPGSSGGAGGEESDGGNGSDGGSSEGYTQGGGGAYGAASISGGNITGSTGGAGGYGGSSGGCTSGTSGSTGARPGDARWAQTPAPGDGGAAGFFDLISQYTDIGIGLIGIPDCSQPPRSNFVDSGLDMLPSYGGSGGGGGGGLVSGGGGGGSDDSGNGGGGGGASGTSFSAASMQVGWWYGDPEVDIEAVTQPPHVTSASSATFVVGQPSSVALTASGIDTPYVYVTGNDILQVLADDITSTGGEYGDGTGNGTGTLAGTPSRADTTGVFNLTTRACTSIACDNEPFTLTIDEAPSFTNASGILFAQNQPNTFTVSTQGYPAAAISATAKPDWLTVTDNGNGTATLTGTPPGDSGNTATVSLTATNTVGQTPQQESAQQTLTLTIVKALSISSTSTHLVPSFNQGELAADPTLWEYERGWQQQFTVTATRPDDSTFDATSQTLWSSSNPAVAMVSSSGLVQSTQSQGLATVTAGTAGALAATAQVTVAVPESITVSPVTPDMIPLQTQQFTATGVYADGTTADLTDRVEWSSASPQISISDSGLGIAGTGGYGTVIATQFTSADPGEIMGFATPIVTHGNVTSIDLTPSQTTVTANGMATFSATVHYQDGTIDSSNQSVRWSASDVSGTNVAFVGQGNGSSSQIVGLHNGTAKVTASYTNKDGSTATQTATLKVITVPVSLEIQGCTNLPITRGQTCQLTAYAQYNTGDVEDVTDGVHWQSSAPGILAVSSTGLLTATGTQEGAASNVDASMSYSGVNGTTTIGSNHLLPSVTNRNPVSLSISPSTVATMHPGDSQQFTATGHYADGSTADLTTVVQWEVDDNTTAGISSGLLHINSRVPANSTIHVTAYVPSAASASGPQPEVDAPGYPSSIPVSVTDPLDHVDLVPNSPVGDLAAGEPTTIFHVVGYDRFGNMLRDVTTDSIVSISPDGTCSGTGAITCVATTAGLHTITASDPGAATPAAGESYQFHVNAGTTNRVALTGGSTLVDAGQDTAPYVVTAYDMYGNATNVTGQSTFDISPNHGQAMSATAGGTTYYTGCHQPSLSPYCYAYLTGDYTVTATVGGRAVEAPLHVDPSLAVSSIVLSGGPTGTPPQVALGSATVPYTVTATDIFGNPGAGGDTFLTISPDGTCDESTRTCTPASAVEHTVTALGYPLDWDAATSTESDMLKSNSLELDVSGPDHLVVTGDAWIGTGATSTPFHVEAYDAHGGDMGDVTDKTTLSISPDGSCDATTFTCTAGTADTGGSHHTVTATYEGGTPTAQADLTVEGVDHVTISGGSSDVTAGGSTAPVHVEGYAADDTDLGDVTANTTLAMSGAGTCDQVAHTCFATDADANGSTHTLTATYNGGASPAASVQVEVDASSVIGGIQLVGGSSSIVAGDSTAPYEVDATDQYGNPIGDVTAFAGLSIGPADPGSSCDQTLHTCTATTADTAGTHTVTADVGQFQATAALTVTPAPLDHLELSDQSNTSFQVGQPTNAYTAEGYDVYGNDVGDVTGSITLSISPDGSCNDVALTCTAAAPDFDDTAGTGLYSQHTVTATDGTATGSSQVFFTPNYPPFDFTYGPQINDAPNPVYTQTGDFQVWIGPTQDQTHLNTVYYTLEQQNSVPGSPWQVVASGLTCPGTGNCDLYDFGTSGPAEAEGTWTFRVIATAGVASNDPSAASAIVSVDTTPPTTSTNIPTSGWLGNAQAPNGQFAVTFSADDGFGSGVQADGSSTWWATCDPQTDPNQCTVPPAAGDPGYSFYQPNSGQPQLLDGQVVFYYSVDNAGNIESVQTSDPIHIDYNPPQVSDDFVLVNDPGLWTDVGVPVHLTATDSQTSDESGVLAIFYTVGTPTDIMTPTTSSRIYDVADPPVVHAGEEIEYIAEDNAGNVSTPNATPGMSGRSLVAAPPKDQVVTFTSSAPVSAMTGSSYTPLASVDSGLAPDFSATGTCAWDAGSSVVHMTGAGTCTVTASQPGNAYYNPATDADQTFQVAPADQVVTFTSSAPTSAVTDDVYTPTARVDSGLAATFSATGACTWDANAGVVTMTAAGTCTVTATQVGNVDYNPAHADQSFTVSEPPPAPSTGGNGDTDAGGTNGGETGGTSGGSSGGTTGGTDGSTGATNPSPKAKLAAIPPKQTVYATLIAKGLTATVAVNAKGDKIVEQLTITPKLAKQLGLLPKASKSRKPVVIATVTTISKRSGALVTKIKLTRKAKAVLGKLKRKTLATTLRITVTGHGGKHIQITKIVKLHRR